MNGHPKRFVLNGDAQVEQAPWCRMSWLCRPGMLDAKQLMVVRAEMPASKGHDFHCHPSMEEVIYILEGTAEQWVGRERRTLNAGEIAHIPANEVHATFNASDRPLVFLAILSPAIIDGPALVDVSKEEPWRSLRNGNEWSTAGPQRPPNGRRRYPKALSCLEHL